MGETQPITAGDFKFTSSLITILSCFIKSLHQSQRLLFVLPPDNEVCSKPEWATMLKAIFYARFHPERGPSIIHQYPPNSVLGSASTSDDALINFSHISSYVIPPYELCNRPLSICTNGYRVLGFPVSLEDSNYERNRFTFNVCFVLGDDASSELWSKAVSKTAGFFSAIEKEDGLLQAEELLADLKWAGELNYPTRDVGIVYTTLEAITEDLNTYNETCVRIDDHHVLNLAISPSKAPPAKVRAWDVPLLVRPVPTSDEWTWDLTLQRIHLHVDGVNHVQRIAQLGDVELKLVKKAVRELVYHERAMLLDIFHFQAIYALKAGFSWFVNDESMQDECTKYVARYRAQETSSTPHGKAAKAESPATAYYHTIIELYRDLHSGISIHDFYLHHEARLENIDIRRLITYGVIKGFLRRVNKYAIAIESQQTPPRLSTSNGSTMSRFKLTEEAEKEHERAWKKAAFSSGWATPPTEPPSETAVGSTPAADSVEIDMDQEDKLRSYLDGKHCMDEICVAMRMSEKKVIERLRSGRFGEVVFFCK